MNEVSKPQRNGKKAPPKKRGRGRPRLSESAQQDDSRERLLEAAIKLFARHGYDPVTTGAVAQEAGLTQSMVHYHFGSKHKLWEAAIHRLMRKRGAAFPTFARDLEGMAPVDRLKELTRRLIQANADHPDSVRIGVHEGTVPGPRLNWLVDSFYAPGFRVFDDAVREAIDDGAIADLPVHDVTNAITSAASLTFGLRAMVERIYGIDMNEPERVQSFADTLVELIFQGLLVKPDESKTPPATDN